MQVDSYYFLISFLFFVFFQISESWLCAKKNTHTWTFGRWCFFLLHSNLDMHCTLSMGSVCQSTEIKGEQHTLLARCPEKMNMCHLENTVKQFVLVSQLVLVNFLHECSRFEGHMCPQKKKKKKRVTYVFPMCFWVVKGRFMLSCPTSFPLQHWPLTFSAKPTAPLHPELQPIRDQV